MSCEYELFVLRTMGNILMNWRRLERNIDIDSTHKTFIDDGDGPCIYIIFSNGIPLETMSARPARPS